MNHPSRIQTWWTISKNGENFQVTTNQNSQLQWTIRNFEEIFQVTNSMGSSSPK